LGEISEASAEFQKAGVQMNERSLADSQFLGSFFDDDDFIFTCGYELIGDDAFRFAVPKGTSLEVKRRLLAGYKASQLGCKSIDYVLKMYGSKWDLTSRRTEISRLVSEATSKTRSRVDAITRKIPALRELPDYPGAVAAYVAITRLQSSFKAACLLCEVGLSFEVFCISKLILEQIAWAYAVHSMKDESFSKVPPSKCISQLRSLFPQVGTWYGLINEHSHMGESVIPDLARMEHDHLAIVLRDPQQALVSAFWVLRLADVLGVYVEVIWRPHYATCEFIKQKSPPSLKVRRTSLTELDDFRKRARECLLSPEPK
jgi:hypothetical protein